MTIPNINAPNHYYSQYFGLAGGRHLFTKMKNNNFYLNTSATNIGLEIDFQFFL